MLGVVADRNRLVNQKHRDAVLDAVCAAKPGLLSVQDLPFYSGRGVLS